MSDSIGAALTGASDYGAYGVLVGQSQIVRTRLDLLTEQAATGLVSTVFSGLGAQGKLTLDLRAETTQQNAEIAGLNAAGARLGLTQTALTQISSIAASFYSQTVNLNGLNPSTVDTVAASARASLQQLAGLLNTQSGSNYIFAGADSANPPVPTPDAILSSGFYAGIAGAVAGLGANGAAATIAATLATASSNAAGVSPFSAALSQPAGTLAAGLPAVQLGGGQRAVIAVAASANGAAISSGGSTTGSYIRDLMRSLATLGSLTSGQLAAPGFAAVVADTRSALQGAVAAISDEQGILGNTATALTGRVQALTSTNTALSSQISNIENVDFASIQTQLAQTQTTLQASYRLIAGLGNFSLLKYL